MLYLNIFKNLIPATALCLFLVTASNAQDSQIISLEQAIEFARMKNPSLIASRWEVNASRARVTQARAAYYPQITASANAARTWSDLSDSSFSDDTSDNYETGLSISQYLYDFGKTPALVEAGRQDLGASEKDLETVEKTLVRDVKQAYFEVLKNQQLLDVDRENIEVRNLQLDQARALYRQGMRPRIDVTRAEVEISQARLSLVKQKFALKEAVIAFEKLLGGPPASWPYILAEADFKMPPVLSLDRLIENAVDKRPEIAGLKAQVESSRASLLYEKRNAYPSVSASGSALYDDDEFPMADREWRAGVYLTWPLFTGFKQTARVEEATANLNKLGAALLDSKLSVKQEVSRAYFLLQTAGETIRSAETALRQSTENLAIAKGRYKAGVSDVIEFSDAQMLYTESKSTLVQASYEFQNALAELIFAVGGPLTPDGLFF